MRLVSSASRAFDTAVGSSVSLRPLRSVEPGIPSGEPLFASRPDEAVVNEFPISRAKVTPPPIREETLSRERLLGWLDSAVLRKVVFVVAEAGYGKTTLLADFSRHTRVRCLWFKLDGPDGDWMTFLHYLVAAGREARPDFAPLTSELLGQTGESIKEAAIQAFASELAQLADRPTAFVLDDYHLVEGQPEVARIVQRMIRFLPERMSLIFLSRRRPTLRVARLHALDEVRELDRNDLRFSRDETVRLFSEAYKQPLEADVLDVVDSRTEGWAASLQLLRSGLRGRSTLEVRAFVGRMSATEGHLYEYLAEEVVGDLPDHLRQFLIRTSVLDKVTPELARAALSTNGGATATLHEVRTLIQSGEAIGLLSRRGESSKWSHRYHPLIQEYLVGRLSEELTPDEIRELHRTIAREAEATSWAVAAHHQLEAGDLSEVVATIERQISAIASSGQYSIAAQYLSEASSGSEGEISTIVKARIDLHAGRVGKARAYLQATMERAPSRSPEILQMLMSIAIGLGEMEAASQLARLLLDTEPVPEWQTLIAHATIGMRDASLFGSLQDQITRLEQATLVHEREKRWHLAAISRYNLADVRHNSGEYEGAANDARKSIEFLRRSAGDANEIASAFGLLALTLLAADRQEESRAALAEAQGVKHSRLYDWEIAFQRAEYLVEVGQLDEGLAGAQQAAGRLGSEPTSNALAAVATIGVAIATKAYDYGLAGQWLSAFDTSSPTTLTAAVALQQLSRARLRLLSGDLNATNEAEAALALSRDQGAWHLAWRASLVASAASKDALRLEQTILDCARDAPSALRAEAAVICGSLQRLDPIPEPLTRYIRAAPQAWLPHLRHGISDQSPLVRQANGALLDQFGEWSDVARLRALARDSNLGGAAKGLGRELSRRTAPRLVVHDLGRTHLEIAGRSIEATRMRRKVAALVIYLMTRPGFTATREQVLEGLWPDSPPEVGTNSLHQTIYFLRRELEPAYSEESSPGYVRLEGELVWLNPELVDSASRQFLGLVSTSRLDHAACAEAIKLYRGRFAPEFEYEEWAISSREALHAAYFEVVERTVRVLASEGQWLRGAETARQALAVDPSAEAIERNLISLYHHSGSHAAAAEQYAHFAARHRAEYGVEPPSLHTLLDRT
jgi:ATP/maltotriose-dependent transcriptional regulator MalT/DNA-binding SARP family transcriptional activator